MKTLVIPEDVLFEASAQESHEDQYQVVAQWAWKAALMKAADDVVVMYDHAPQPVDTWLRKRAKAGQAPL